MSEELIFCVSNTKRTKLLATKCVLENYFTFRKPSHADSVYSHNGKEMLTL